jgi:uracil-DNA glycosylase
MSKINIIYNCNITNFRDSQVIALNCNCTEKKEKDLLKEISDKYPYANFYSSRKEDSKCGTVKLVGGPKKGGKYICALFSQVNPGKPSLNDSSLQRKEWFKDCLEVLSLKKGIKSIAFQSNFGFNYSKRDLNDYKNILETWSMKNSNIIINIIDSKSKNDLQNGCDLGETSSDYIKEKIDKLSDYQKARLLEHLLLDNSIDILKTNSDLIDNITLSGDRTEFYKWAWKKIINMNIPFIDITSFTKLHDNEDEKKDNEDEKKDNDNEDEKNDNDNEDEKNDNEDCLWKNISLIDFSKKETPKMWEAFFKNIIETDEFKVLSKLLYKESKKYELYPPIKDIYGSFIGCNPSNIKVIIIGQDPYHTENAAMGIAFGHRDSRVKLQPSLRNIYKCLENDGFSTNWNSGNLSHWKDQGVFLINTSLTVRKGEAASHTSKSKNTPGPWECFTKELFTHLEDVCDHLVIIMWGIKAQNYSSFFSQDKNLHIKAPHPAASSYNPSNTEFIDHKPFSKSNTQLKLWNNPEIDWNL